ncbi:MAG: sterol desaturase family protein [Bacteroidetes bacterium]|nr:sterol desaturase family protein [Bacteroidota bacterium]
MQTLVSSSKIFRADTIAFAIDWLVFALVFLSGFLHPNPKIFYESVVYIFLIIFVPLIISSYLVYYYSENHGLRIQGERKKTPPLKREIIGEMQAVFLVACIGAWPVGLYRAGLPTGLFWSLSEMGLSWWMVILQVYAGIIAVDAITYWKHRLLHTRLFFPFHKFHHTFRDPTAFASFTQGPVEIILTFWPILLICFPLAKHFAPLYFTSITGFVVLNLYLHCGVTFTWLEKILPRIGLNTSSWHNIHHSDVNANYGEVSSIWDKICKTTKADYIRRKASANAQ